MTDDRAPTDSPIDVWMDGDCALCRSSRRWCEARDIEKRLEFSDFRSAPDHALPTERRSLENSMWVREPDGTLREGFGAWRRIMAELPGWRWLAWLTGLPPFRWLGPGIYRFIARHRHLLPSS
jgi:predicted DCC family thiol-disulfide oxidoreductase YuxK